ncbi:hypothetical protein [Priestia megaterium]|uniref:Uncharacterized protein n=1 Tax=Priestia megaterium TaxID=1404 RepID=A0A6M6E2J2_PRIMG|nr:hypothetical protein [Priestia megaterium]QJX79966.1 hypothetical protein FDZ14_28090 [Priestia megaterium]
MMNEDIKRNQKFDVDMNYFINKAENLLRNTDGTLNKDDDNHHRKGIVITKNGPLVRKLYPLYKILKNVKDTL